MKKLLVIAGLLFSIASQAQVGELFGGTANVFAVDDNTGPQFIFRAFFNEAASRWTGDSTQVGDHVFVFSGNKVYRLTVDSILAESSALVTLRVRDSTATLASFPTGVCALMRLTDNNLYPATIPGLPSVLYSKILTYFAEQAEQAVGGSGTGVTTGVKGDINVVGADSDWQIVNNAVGTNEIAVNAVTTGKIADANVTTAKLVDTSITTAKIRDLNVTTAKLNADAVTNAKLDNMPAGTIKGNPTGGSANPTDITLATLKGLLGANEYCRDTITQASHGFSKAEAVYYDGTEYVSMIGLYGDSQEPHFLVIDSTTVNTFVVAACGIVNDTFGLAEGLYYSTDTGLSVTPDTVEYPIAKVFDGKTIVMALPGFEFDATGKSLIDVAGLVGGQRTFLGGQVIPLLLDSIAVIDTICGTPVETLAEYLIALEDCADSVPDSLQRSNSPTGLGTAGRIGYMGSDGKLKDDADLEYDETNQRVRVSASSIGTGTTASTKNFILRNTSLGVVGTAQYPPMIEFEGNVYCTTPAANVVAKSHIGFSYTNGAAQGVPTFIVSAPSPISGIGNYQTLVTVRSGTSNGLTGAINIGSFNTFTTNGTVVGNGSGVSGTGNPVAVGYTTYASNGGYGIGYTVSSAHSNAMMTGSFLQASAASTSLFGSGSSSPTKATIASGTGLVDLAGISQLRVMGLTSASNSWTTSGDTVTLTTPLTLNLGEAIQLNGVNESFHTIIQIISSTRFRINSASGSASGSTIRYQLNDVLQLGNGGASYNQHLAVNRSGLFGFGITSPTSKIHLQAGTALVAPFGFTAGVDLTTPLAGKLEWDGSVLKITQTTGPTRKTLAYTTDIIATDLTMTGTTPIFTLNSSTGTDVTFTAGSNIALIRTSNDLTVATIEQWGEVAVSGGSTSVTTGTPELPDGDTPGTPTGNTTSEFTQTGSTVTYTAAAGQVEITGSLNFTPTTGGDYLISIFQEGVEIAKSEVRVTVAAGAYESVALPKFNVTVATNDTFDIRIEPTSGSDTITVHRYVVYSRKVY